jgi:hypothetical protein
MRHLLHGFDPALRPARRWQETALIKKREIDGQITRLKAMRRLVDRASRCQCMDLSECGRVAASVLEPPSR